METRGCPILARFSLGWGFRSFFVHVAADALVRRVFYPILSTLSFRTGCPIPHIVIPSAARNLLWEILTFAFGWRSVLTLR